MQTTYALLNVIEDVPFIGSFIIRQNLQVYNSFLMLDRICIFSVALDSVIR